MAKKKTKENPEVPARITKEYRTKKPGSLWGKEGEVWCTVKVVEGVLPSGTRYITENIFPDHTPEEEKKWEENVKRACRDFVDAYIRDNGYEAARARFAVE